MAQKLIKFETIDRSDDIAMKSDIDPQMGIFEAERVANERIRVDNEEDRVEAEGLREAAKEATIEATRLANISTIDSNTAAILANTKAGLASTKAGLADSAAINANDKAGLAVTATTNANNAADLANTKAGIAQTAADNANDAAGYAQEQGNLASDINETAISNEAARIYAEGGRTTNEIARVKSNNLMENAEAWRINREDQRGINELDRATAEGLREQAKADTIEATENANNAADLANAAKGWTHSVVFEEYNGKQIKKLTGYIGGTGIAPTDNIGLYFTEGGFTADKDLATDFRGTDGIDGIDGETIANTNASSTITNAKVWIGTRAQYDAQIPLADDVLIFILQ